MIQPPTPATDIRGVLRRLDTLEEQAHNAGSTLGLFVVLYGKVSREVARGIEAGEFDDAARMDAFDTEFANRYFAALRAFLGGESVGRAWGVAFRATEGPRIAALQHLLLGINAHINVDLGAAAAAVRSGAALDAMRRDFDRVGEILSRMTDSVQDALGSVSPRMVDLDKLGGSSDERLALFSVSAAREAAWSHARTLDAVPGFLRATIERAADHSARLLGRLIVRPLPPFDAVMKEIVRAEEPDVATIMEALR